jgi:bilin biosynthesis protein
MALGQVGKQAVALLLEVSRGDNPAQGVAAINALAEINDPKVEEGFNALLNEETLDCYVKETLSSAVMRLKDLQRVRRPDCSAD